MGASNEGGGVFAPEAGEDEKPADLSLPTQKPLKTRASDYVELGSVAIGPASDGGVQIAGGPPAGPAPGLSSENLVCIADPASGRAECRYYTAFLTDAEGVTRGSKEQPKQIRRYCARLSTASELMELGDTPVYACTARNPQDLVSARVISDFEKKQRDVATERARESGEMDF